MIGCTTNVVCVEIGAWYCFCFIFFFFQAEDGIRDLVRSRGLGDVYKRQGPIRPAWVDALGGECQEEILAHLQTAAFAQFGQHQFARGARVGARFQHDDHPAVQIGRERLAGVGDERQVGVASFSQRGGHAAVSYTHLTLPTIYSV